MNRKIFSVFLALTLCFGLGISVFAEPKAIDFVIDEFGILTTEEINDLNELGYRIYEQTGVGVFFAFVQADTLMTYDYDWIVNGMEDYVIMLENVDSWYAFYSGKGETIGLAEEEVLRSIYYETETYAEGVEAFFMAAAEYFPAITEESEEESPKMESGFLFDYAGLLSDSEVDFVSQRLEELSETYQAQVVIITVDAVSGSIDTYVNDIYDSSGFGYGTSHDGVLLLISMDLRQYRILSNGFAARAIENDQIDRIGELIEPDLSDGDYAEAFSEFANECEYYLNGYLNGFPFKLGKNLVISLMIGAIIGLMVAFALKGQLKSVRKQAQANLYVKTDSMQITGQKDTFLYRRVTKTAKSSSSSSGSSGGSSRNVGGGSF